MMPLTRVYLNFAMDVMPGLTGTNINIQLIFANIGVSKVILVISLEGGEEIMLGCIVSSTRKIESTDVRN